MNLNLSLVVAIDKTRRFIQEQKVYSQISSSEIPTLLIHFTCLTGFRNRYIASAEIIEYHSCGPRGPPPAPAILPPPVLTWRLLWSYSYSTYGINPLIGWGKIIITTNPPPCFAASDCLPPNSALKSDRLRV